jgi:phage tail-like protein
MSDPRDAGIPAGATDTPPAAPVIAEDAPAYDMVHRGGASGRPHGAAAVGAALSLDHVADHYRRYPGELITFYTRVRVLQPVDGFLLQVFLPAGVEVDGYQASDPLRLPMVGERTVTPTREPLMLPGADGEPFPVALPDRFTEGATRTAPMLTWEVAEAQEAGAIHTFVTAALVLPTPKPGNVRSTAVLTVRQADAEQEAISETVEFAVETKGRYLSYLPALYEQDDFMTRFLMLFESFWAPIDHQIAHLEHYFDPDLTPPEFLPWLAGWFNLVLDDSLDEGQRRELLGMVMWLYRRRGTRVALQRYLEILTRNPVEIIERRARNFSLGRGARLGVGVALGTGNRPHTFTVQVRLAPIAPPPGFEGEAAEREAARLEAKRRALLHRVIMAEKPAHAGYHLEILGE